MACRLFSAKPLPKPMLAYCQLDAWKQISVKSNRNYIIFIQKDAFEIVVVYSRFETAENVSWNELSFRRDINNIAMQICGVLGFFCFVFI